jgi:5-methylcytosine-specific restriction protein A
MPRAPLKPCAAPGCSALVVRGRCKAHAVQVEHQRGNYDVRRWYRTARWKALRALVLQEEPICAECHAEGRIVASTDVHHTQKHDGDYERFFARETLTSLCHAHHAVHTGHGE